tara:strand:- start:584 stop:928 length:345 start_codon:yes stop_codon:yes gene_type:complete
MPNNCQNHLTIVCDNVKQLNNIYKHEFDVFKYNTSINVKTEKGLVVNITTSWRPFDLTDLLNKYDTCWIKNEWEEEGGTSGVFVGGYLNGSKVETKSLEWNDLSIEGKHYYFTK